MSDREKVINDQQREIEELEERLGCKDCKHYEGNGTCMKNGIVMLTESWFCADGIRREGR